MIFDKYRYDRWPEDGIEGIDADYAVNLAIEGKLHAYAFFGEDLNLLGYLDAGYETDEDRTKDLYTDFPGHHSDGLILLPEYVDLIAYAGSAKVAEFRCYGRDIREANIKKYGTYQYPEQRIFLKNPLPLMERGDLVFYTADLMLWAKSLADPIYQPVTDEQVTTPHALRDVIVEFVKARGPERANIRTLLAHLDKIAESDQSPIIVHEVKPDGSVEWQNPGLKPRTAKKKTIENLLSQAKKEPKTK